MIGSFLKVELMLTILYKGRKLSNNVNKTITRTLRFAMCDNYNCVVPIGATTPEGFAKRKGQDSDRHFDTPQLQTYLQF